MRKLAATLFVLTLSLWAADFWQSKPYTEWSEKDIDKLLHNSPWARQVSLSPGGSGGQMPSSRGGGRNRTGDMGEIAGASTGGTGEMAGGGGGAGGGGRQRGGGGLDEMSGGGATPSISVTLTWESSLPVRQARVKAKYGSEAATSPEAKKIIDQDPNMYVIAVVGPALRAMAGRGGESPEEMKKAVMEQTSLSVKGKDPIKCSNIQVGRADALFFFPKTTPLTLDDKDVEFSTRIGQIPVKYKFHVKDMVFNGKLDL